MHPKDLKISDYTYDLPDDRIAKYPLEQRDASKLLIYKNGNISETVFSDILSLLPAGSLLVLNNSKVIEARLLFQKSSGGTIEIFTLEPHEQYTDITTAMNTCESILYKCLVGGASKWKHGMVLSKEIQHADNFIHLEAKIVERRTDCFVIELKWTPTDLPFASILHALGEIPIPPYLHRDAQETDKERYQTVYARSDGSVAAPTAGLHFTPAILQQLDQKNIKQAYITLHVGAGTFMPLKTDTMSGHEMHAEFIEITTSLLEQLLYSENIIAVGTTSMRTLESIYWMGVKAFLDPSVDLQHLAMQQWEVYDNLMNEKVEKNVAIETLINWMTARQMKTLIVKTQIIIAPGYRFRMAHTLITNFHQPQSTLLLLVSAFAGNDWRKIYQYALENEFLFLSYGDSSLLFQNAAGV